MFGLRIMEHFRPRFQINEGIKATFLILPFLDIWPGKFSRFAGLIYLQ